VMKRILTLMSELIIMLLAGKTEAGSAEEQLARDSQLKATNCRGGGSLTPAIPFYEQGQFGAFSCLKKPPCRRQGSLLITKWICPIHAEPVQPYGKDKKIARILMNKERWDQPFDRIDPSGGNYLNKKEKVQEKLGIDDKYKEISQIEKSLADKEQKDQHERKLYNTCNLARKNLMAIVSFSVRAEVINDILSELNKNELNESLVHAFVQLPKFIAEDYSKLLQPEYIKMIRQFSEKYDEEGLTREEQVELFQAHQEINKQILDELYRIQDDFEEILQINESQE